MIKKIRKITVVSYLAFGAAFFCGMGAWQNREELGTLKEQGEAEAVKKKELSEQEIRFQKVQEAVKRHQLRSGISSKEVLSNYGKPNAVTLSDVEGERWLYRSHKGKWLDKPWIFLYFDRKKILTHWECGHTECT